MPLQLSGLCPPSPPRILHRLRFLPTPGQRQPKEARVPHGNPSLGPPATATHTHTHTHKELLLTRVSSGHGDSLKSTTSEGPLEIGQTPAHCFHAPSRGPTAWTLMSLPESSWDTRQRASPGSQPSTSASRIPLTQPSLSVMVDSSFWLRLKCVS